MILGEHTGLVPPRLRPRAIVSGIPVLWHRFTFLAGGRSSPM
jgi:hypothetical protein